MASASGAVFLCLLHWKIRQGFQQFHNQVLLHTKPFVIGALQRKIKAMFSMLEHHKPAKDIYDDGMLFLDFSEQTASLNGKPLTLSPMEYKMLNLFRKNPKQVLTRQQLLEKLWDVDEKFVDEHTLTTTVSRIRSKIEADGGNENPSSLC